MSNSMLTSTRSATEAERLVQRVANVIDAVSNANSTRNEIRLGDDEARPRRLRVPDLVCEQMLDHCAPPLSALTGCMRDIRHAG